MSVISHEHIDDIIVDADSHFTINTTTRAISNGSNKKLTIMQYDHNSERYSFDIDRIIEGHDLTDCNRVQIHFINIGSNKDKHPGLYLVDDVQVMSTDDSKITFTWLVSQDATMLAGALGFLISFECVEGDKVLYRWSSSVFKTIEVTSGMDNDNTVIEMYADELLAWQNHMETVFIPNLVDECYINRDFATSEEVAAVFDISNPDGTTDVTLVPYIVDSTPSDGSDHLVTSGGIKAYVDNAVTNAITQTLGGNY